MLPLSIGGAWRQRIEMRPIHVDPAIGGNGWRRDRGRAQQELKPISADPAIGGEGWRRDRVRALRELKPMSTDPAIGGEGWRRDRVRALRELRPLRTDQAIGGEGWRTDRGRTRIAFKPLVGLVIALLVVGVSTARADGAGVIAVTSGDRAATSAAMTEAMAGRARRIVGDAVGEARAAVAAGALPVDALAKFKRVRELVDEGWRAYLRVAVEVAAQRLTTARTEAEALTALPGGSEVYADAALRLGIVHTHLGRKQEANTVFALALALDPERPITKAEFDPDVVEAIEAVRAAPPVLDKLRVTSNPGGALIRIDGKELGRAPVELELPRGQHVIVGRLPQHQVAVQGVALGESPVQVELMLDPDREVARLASGASLSGAGLDEVAQQELVDATLRYADLDEVIIIAETTRRGGPTLLAQRCAGLPARCSAVVDIGFADGGLAGAARSAWDAVRTGELRYKPSVLGERAGRSGPKRCEVCRSPWLWGGVGAALVAGAVITVIAASGSKPPPIVGVDPSQFLPR